MLKEGTGNLLKVEADALVNTVNTVGIMGKGVALQFKQAFPDNFRAYEAACKRNEVRLGCMFVTRTEQFQPRLIINFPTKGHWRANSRLEDIREGLKDLVRVVNEEALTSLAMPPLGCGFGGLRWEDVHPLIESAFSSMPDVEVTVFPPGGVQVAAERVVGTPKPDLTPWRAALIKIVDAYGVLGFDATHLEAQKLIYLLQASGEDIKARFVKGQYGPYDDGMRHGLLNLEGHYVVGLGDADRLAPVRLTDNAAKEADEFIASSQHAELSNHRISRVRSLIEGFESPYGLELLASVHWVIVHDGADSEDDAVNLVHEWNSRKRKSLKAGHLRIAYRRIMSEGWVKDFDRR